MRAPSTYASAHAENIPVAVVGLAGSGTGIFSGELWVEQPDVLIAEAHADADAAADAVEEVEQPRVLAFLEVEQPRVLAFEEVEQPRVLAFCAGASPCDQIFIFIIVFSSRKG